MQFKKEILAVLHHPLPVLFLNDVLAPILKEELERVTFACFDEELKNAFGAELFATKHFQSLLQVRPPHQLRRR